MQHDQKATDAGPATPTGAVVNAPANRDIAANLRADIVSGEFRPNARLKFAELTKRYDVGVGTLREALKHLTSEGFVTLEANKGFAVAPISVAELIEVSDLYIELEQRAIASAMTHGDDVWEGQIVFAQHRLGTIEQQHWEERVVRHSEWVIRHREFHESLVAACQGPWLLRMRSMMFDQMERYRFLTKMASTGDVSPRLEQHKEIMAAVLARDFDAVAGLIESHIRETEQRAISLMEGMVQNND